MRNSSTTNRYVRLTDSGVRRLQAVRRQYRSTVEDIVVDPSTPSVNTVKRALKQHPVFMSTLERIWDYFRRRAAEAGERLPYLVEGEDFEYVDEPEAKTAAVHAGGGEAGTENPGGWISRGVPRPNRLFTGRGDVLDRLHEALKHTSAALVSDPQAITGLGGIGKTQTALAYVYAHWRSYSRVFWVTADTIESLDDGLAALAEEMGLLSASPATKPQALRMIHDWFARESGWLLVLDNADDLDAIAPHFPRHHAGRLILTTRARNPVKWASPIALHKFGPDDGALLLLRRAGMLDVRQTLSEAPAEVVCEAKALSEDLDGLPLAIDQAGAYLAETGASIAVYRRRFREEGLRILDASAEPEHASVTVTFTLALAQMTAHTLYGGSAAELARLAAFLVPEEMPETIFANHRFDSAHGDPPLEEVYAAATRFSLMTRNVSNHTFTMHRLVQRVIRESMTEEERREWRGKAVEAVSAASPDFEYEQWSLCEQLLPQWRACAEYIRRAGIATSEAAYLLYQTGRYLRARALYSEAETCIREALTIAERVFGPVHRVVADYVDELACLYRTLDRTLEAESLHKRAVETLERLLGPDDVLLTSKLHNMALLYYQVEDYGRAEQAFLRALAIHAKQAEPDRSLIATAMTQLAGVYRASGRFDRAEEYCRGALITYEEILDPAHVDLATANNNLALLYLTMGRYADADACYTRALAINRRARGPRHPETAVVLWGLARVHWKLGHPEQADALFHESLAIFNEHLGPDHSRTRRVAESYAEFQSQLPSILR